jgi:type II secretory pathway pseudopilin PulG
MRCLEKDRTRRYETANGLAMDLQRHLRNEPVVARPPSSAYLLQKLIRRHRVGVAAAGVVLGVVVLGAMATATQATRALRAERQQNELREAARQAQAKEAAARHAAEATQLRSEKQRLARQHLMPEIDRLMQALDIAGAFAAALEAEKYLPDDPGPHRALAAAFADRRGRNDAGRSGCLCEALPDSNGGMAVSRHRPAEESPAGEGWLSLAVPAGGTRDA